jgi:protein-S-isoprenylcysteine O-methyltransferase Ste14
MSRYKKWAQKEHSLGVRIAATLPAGLIIVILLPYLIVWVGPALDQRFGLPPIELGFWNYLLGGLLLLVGLSFALWSVYIQFDRGRGTPLPMLPTQELLVRGPYRYCRNPMTLGTLLAYLGLAIGAGSLSGIGIVLCVAALLITYLKRFEERELTERFGEAYRRYRREVPFIIPRLPKRR